MQRPVSTVRPRRGQRLLRQVQRPPRLVHQFIELRVAQDKGWRNNHGVTHRTHHQSLLDTEIATTLSGFQLLGESLPHGFIADQFQRTDQPDRSGLADQRMRR